MLLFVELFTEVFVPILLVAGFGFRLDRVFKLDLRSLVKLNIYLFVPCFIFVRVASADLQGAEAVRIVVFTAAMVGILGGLALVAAKMLGLDVAGRKTLQLASMFYNCGNWGIPLMALAYGAEGEAVQIFVLMTMNISTFTIGLWLVSTHRAEVEGGSESKRPPVWKTLLPVLRQPALYGVACGLLVRAFNVPVQEFGPVWEPLELVAAGLVPFALVTLGVQLSQTKPPPLRGKLTVALVLKLLIGPAIAVPMTWAFGFEGVTAAVLILGAGAPAAVNTALLAHEFGADSHFATAAVFYSTVLSLVTSAVILTVLKLTVAG